MTAPLQARLPSLLGAPADTVPRLARLGVAILGLGSIGLHVADFLARLQLARLLLCDPRRLKAVSELTHPVAGQAGRLKVDLAAERVRAVSPHTQLRTHAVPLQALHCADLRGIDAVVACLDNPAGELAAHRLARACGIPLIRPAVHGEMLTAQVRCYGVDADSACPACWFGEAERAAVASAQSYSCDGAAREEPSRSTAALAAIAAGLATHQLLRDVLQLGAPVRNTVLTFCGLSGKSETSRLVAASGCAGEHRTYRRIDLGAPIHTHSAAALSALALPSAGAMDLAIPGHPFLATAHCDGCGATPALHRYTAPACPVCGGPLRVPRFEQQASVPLAQLGPAAARPLSELGLPADVPEVLLTTATTGAVLRAPEGNSP